MGTQVEELVSQFEQFLDEQDYTSAIALITGTPEVMESDNLTKQLAYQFARSLIVERFVGMDEPHGLVDMGLFHSNETEFGEEFAIDTTYNGRLTFLPWFIQWRSFSILVRLEVFENGNPFLAELSNCMPNYEGTIYNVESLQLASELNPGFLSNARKWCLEILKNEEVYYYSAFGENEFLKRCRTGSWYSFSNLNVISQSQLSSPCASCGETLVICKTHPCLRNFYSGHTDYNAEIDVVACESETEELDGFEKILIAVSVFSGEVMVPLATRTPTIEGTLNLYKNEQDGKVRLLLADDRLEEDWQGNSAEEYYFEVIESEFFEITHPLLAEGEYLVVSWRNAQEVSDEMCFLWGLYRAKARETIEQALK
jgi:hypothetical protein